MTKKSNKLSRSKRSKKISVKRPAVAASAISDNSMTPAEQKPTKAADLPTAARPHNGHGHLMPNRIIFIIAVLLIAVGLLGWMASRSSKQASAPKSSGSSVEIPLKLDDSSQLPESQAQSVPLQPQQTNSDEQPLQKTQNLQDAGSQQSPQQDLQNIQITN